MTSLRRSPRLQQRRRVEAASVQSALPLWGGAKGGEDSDSSSCSSSSSSSSSSSDDDLAGLAPPLARRRSLSPGRERATMSLARVMWTPDIVEQLISKVRTGEWDSYLPKEHKYRLNKLLQSHEWAVKRLRRNRFVPRVVDEDDVAAAVAQDDDSSENGDSSEGSDDDSSEGSDDGTPVGRAADGSADARKERVLMVKSITRRADRVRADGARILEEAWFEIVPNDRVDSVLGSLWHVGGIQSVSTPKLYAAVCTRYVGVSHAAIASFVARQEAAELSRANLVADKIVSPSLPEALNESWSGDITFVDPSIPSGPFNSFLTVIDALSRMAFTVPLKDKSAATLGAAYEDLFRAHGAPKTLVQDSAKENMSATLRLVAARYGVRRLRFTAPHVSQQNGLVEREHQTLKGLLRRAALDGLKNGAATNFPELLRAVTRQYNETVHAVLKMAPWTVWTGREPPEVRAPILMGQSEGGAGAGAAKKGRGSVATGASQTSHGRKARVELRDLQRGASEISGLRARKAADLGPGMLDRRAEGPRKTLKDQGMSPIDAARARLGLVPATSSQRQLYSAGAGEGGTAGAVPIPPNGGPLVVRRISAVVLDKGVTPNRLLYCVSYEGRGPADDAWVPSTDFGGVSDAQLQAILKRDQKRDPPILFDLPFTGPPDLDRRAPIPVGVVLREVETSDKLNDGQPEGGYPLDAAEEGEDEVEERAAKDTSRGGKLVMRRRTAGEEEEEEEEEGEAPRGPKGRGRSRGRGRGR